MEYRIGRERGHLDPFKWLGRSSERFLQLTPAHLFVLAYGMELMAAPSNSLRLITPNGDREFSSDRAIVKGKSYALLQWLQGEVDLKGKEGKFARSVLMEIVIKDMLYKTLEEKEINGAKYEPVFAPTSLDASGFGQKGGDILLIEEKENGTAEPVLLIDVSSGHMLTGSSKKKGSQGVNSHIATPVVVLPVGGEYFNTDCSPLHQKYKFHLMRTYLIELLRPLIVKGEYEVFAGMSLDSRDVFVKHLLKTMIERIGMLGQKLKLNYSSDPLFLEYNRKLRIAERIFEVCASTSRVEP